MTISAEYSARVSDIMLEPSTRAADELMCPPLMAELMCCDKVGEVDVGGLLQAADEADAFRERNGVGKGLREAAVAGELQDAVLAELKGAEVLLVVSEAGLGGGDHVVDVVGVGGV